MIFQLDRIHRFIAGLLIYFALPVSLAAAYPPIPTQLASTGYNPTLVTDENNHALAITTDAFTNDILTYYFINNNWINIPYSGPQGSYSVAMEPSGAAIMQVFDGATVTTYSFNGTAWTTLSPNPLDATAVNGGEVALLGPGQGLTAWADAGTNVVASFLTGSMWGTPTTLGSGTNSISVAYSANGTAVVAWDDGVDVYASNYNGSIWSLVPTLITTNATLIDLGIDANGNALILLRDDITSNLVASNYNGATWLPVVTIGLGPDLFYSDQPLAMAANGTAVAVWQHNNTFFEIYDKYYSVFNGTSWGPAVLFASGFDGPSPAVSIDDNGNALIIYGINAESSAQVLLGQLSAGGAFSSSLAYQLSRDNLAGVSVAVANNGFSVLGWAEFNNGADAAIPFVAAAVSLAPPTDGSVVSCKNKFAMQTDRVNTISFVPSTDPAIVAYYIRRNGVLIAIIPAAGPYIYQDHNRVKGQIDTYTIVSVNVDGQESIPLVVTSTQ